MRINLALLFEDYILELTCADGSLRLFDMKPLIGMKPWQSLSSKALLEQIKADLSSVTWSIDLDVAPETLWLYSVKVSKAVA